MAVNVTPFVGTDNFNMETFNNMISQINNGVNSEISEVLAQLGTKAKIQTGSYVGTGTLGASNPCSLTFDFEPKIFINGYVTGRTSDGSTIYGIMFILLKNETTYDTGRYRIIYSFNGKRIEWYASGPSASVEEQKNIKGQTYNYIVMG